MEAYGRKRKRVISEAALWTALAIFYLMIGRSRLDHWLTGIYVFNAVLAGIGWKYPRTTVSDGLLVQHGPFYNRTIRLDAIKQVKHSESTWNPREQIEIIPETGKKLRLTLADPEPFLTQLRAAAPQAQYLL
jgi:hypothetical protein